MKIALAQIQSFKGELAKNLQKHLAYIQKAAQQKADWVFFPELSITNYEPELALSLAMDDQHSIWKDIQASAEQKQISVAVGYPRQRSNGVSIGMKIFQNGKAPQLYEKQCLHLDEEAYFVAGEHQLILEDQHHRMAPAICYESMLLKHTEHAAKLQASIYLASVSKHEQGVEAAYQHYPEIAKQFQMHLLMVNSIGPSDNFLASGGSAAWNPKGELIAKARNHKEQLLIVDIH